MKEKLRKRRDVVTTAEADAPEQSNVIDLMQVLKERLQARGDEEQQRDNIERPDRIVLDLDPDPELLWSYMIEATHLLLSVLDDLQLESWLKTSGGKGMHVIVPLARHAGWDTVKTFAKSISAFMTVELPERFTAKMGPRNRKGKIFIDYLRNHRGASTVAKYSVRARPGLPVSVPIRRSELEKLNSAAQWTVANLQRRLEQLAADPWQGYSNRQRLRQSMWRQLGDFH